MSLYRFVGLDDVDRRGMKDPWFLSFQNNKANPQQKY